MAPGAAQRPHVHRLTYFSKAHRAFSFYLFPLPQSFRSCRFPASSAAR